MAIRRSVSFAVMTGWSLQLLTTLLATYEKVIIVDEDADGAKRAQIPPDDENRVIFAATMLHPTLISMMMQDETLPYKIYAV